MTRPGLSTLRLVLTGSLASYPQGGGHWSALLQYLFGLRALGHDLYWLEVFQSTGNRARDERFVEIFFRRFRWYGLEGRGAVLVHDADSPEPTLESMRVYGMARDRIKAIAGSADLLWNFCSGLPKSLLPLFKRRVLIDLDPGILQVSGLLWDVGIDSHDVFLTVGGKLHDPDCDVPTLGVRWQSFLPPVYLPLWQVTPDPGACAPFSTVTEWTWHTVGLEDRLLSASKRDAYLRFVALPRRAGRPFELAANIHPDDETGDRDLALSQGWRLVDPHRVARSPSPYRRYIRRSRAEIACCKPIYRELKTGWFSDRSAGYLASGRPVLAEDTGFGQRLPTGRGLVVFRDMEEAVVGVAEVDADYDRHRRAAREIAEEFLDSRKCLEAMLLACGS